MSIVISQEFLDKLQESREIEGIYLANSLQQGFIYHALRQSYVDNAYLVQAILQYNCQLDVSKFKEAWSYAQKRHPTLRLRFAWEEELLQIIDKEGELYWRYIDLSQESNVQIQEYKIKQIQEEDRMQPYKLEEGNLFRVYLIKQQEGLYTCIFSNHHAILDGWSASVLLGYIHEIYSKLQVQEKITLSIDNSYKVAQRYLQDHRYDNKDYWEEYILQIKERSDLSALLTAPNRYLKISEYKLIKEPEEQALVIRDKLYADLKVLGRNEGVMLNSILQYVWHKILYIYGNSNQTVVGMTVSGRNLPINNIESSVGLYINTLPLIVDHQEHAENNVIELIRNIQNNINEINIKSIVDLAVLQKGGERLFDSIFIYENYPNSTNEELQHKLKVSFKSSVEKLDYPLAVMAYEANNELIFKLAYAGELFNKDSIEYLLLITKKLLEQIVINPYQQIQDLSYLNEAQHKQLIYSWNQTDKLYPENKTIHGLFEEQVVKSPDSTAIVYEDKKLTYHELNEKANQLAHYLRRTYDIKKDTLITLCLDRNEHMLIAILAVLKAGGAYVPMDPNYPDERIRYILKDTNTKLVLTNDAHVQKLEAIHKINILAIDEESVQKELTAHPGTNSEAKTTSMDLAYVIYTSGTTGNPKGVMIEHKAYVATIDYIKNFYFTDQQSIKTYSVTNYVFDIFGLEYGVPLLSGGVISMGTTEFSSLDCSEYDFIQMTPSLSDLKLDSLKNLSHTKLFIGGENLSYDLLNRALNKSVNVVNVYGPTESTIWSTSKFYVYKDNKHFSSVSLGKPFDNEKVYVLDANLKPLPIGAIGELYIGGVGLARGYLNRPELTAERFIGNPFQSEEEKPQNKNTRLYKTGDLVRWLADGELEYIGRSDFQVKIRGYRIELGEIESVLSSFDGVKQSVVLAKENKESEGALQNKYLVGYYVSSIKLNEDSILNHLSSKLPEYMVPNVLVHLEKLPLTATGKLDRQALPDPEFTNEDDYVAPRNEFESKVCQIWGEVLGIPKDKIGILDNFFRLGGNSISAIRLISKLNKELNRNIQISTIFKHNSIEKLACYFGHNTDDSIVIEKLIINGVEEQSLSFAQERLWFIEKYEEGSNAYNIPMVYRLASHTKLDILEKSIRSVVSRHEILRTLIKEDNEGNGYQLVLDDIKHPLQINKVSVVDNLQLDLELKKQINQVYDLSKEYPIRVSIYELPKQDKGKPQTEYYLSVVIHHIAFDGWSVDIFLKELQECYNYYLDQSRGLEAKLNLPELSIQYKDFALWQRNYLSGERLDKQFCYWKNKLDGYEALNLITDKPRPTQIDYTGKDISFEIDEATSKSLRELAKKLKVSLYSLLLSGYLLMLRAYSNQDDIVIGTPIANRHYSQIENLIGLFINSLALRTKIDSKMSVKEFIQEIGNEVVEAQFHQDLPFEKLVEELKVMKDTSRHPIFQVMFGVQNFGNTEKNDLLQVYTEGENLYNIAKFDISTLIDDSRACLRGNFNYAVSLYREETITRFIETYTEVLRQLTRSSEGTKIQDLSYLNEAQHKQLIYSWNQTDKLYPENKTIHGLFEEQVVKSPDSTAIVYEDKKLTYHELNEKANQLAHYLRRTYDIKKDTLITLCLDRNEHMLIAILAVLKAGGAYVPMDPNYPDERIRYILKDTNTKLVLTNDAHVQKLEAIHKINILAIDEESVQKELTAHPGTNSEAKTTSMDLAYVIYTSGTTGNPKGVMIEHKAYVATIDYIKNFYFTDQQSIKTYSVTNYVFDIFGLEYGVPLLSGGVISMGTTEFSSLDCSEYDFIQMTPSLSDLKLDSLKNLSHTKLFIGGENLSYDLLNRALNKSVNVVNVYGPTESTIWSTSKFYVYKDNKHFSSVSLGKPFDNEKVYVLDANLKPLPIGAIGELYIGGVGLARGYLNRPELTAERFIGNPFQSEEEKPQNKNTRLYKTGDLVRWLADGELEYIGRSDFQVKIRGYRIELGEIESVLSSFDGVKQSVVLAKENKESEGALQNKYLVGYYVSSIKLNEDSILNHLSSKLPEYMVPNVLVHLEKLPLTATGKLDRQALPDPEFTNEDDYVAPRNEFESKVCQIWGEVLGIPKDKIGIRDDFFRSGGDSISAIRLISKLNKEFSSQIRVKDIFELKSISNLVEIIPSNIGNKDTELYVPFSLIDQGVVGI